MFLSVVLFNFLLVLLHLLSSLFGIVLELIRSTVSVKVSQRQSRRDERRAATASVAGINIFITPFKRTTIPELYCKVSQTDRP